MNRQLQSKNLQTSKNKNLRSLALYFTYFSTTKELNFVMFSKQEADELIELFETATDDQVWDKINEIIYDPYADKETLNWIILKLLENNRTLHSRKMSEERAAPQLTLKVAENATEMFHKQDQVTEKLQKILQEYTELQELIDTRKKELAAIEAIIKDRKKWDLEHPPLSTIIHRKNEEIRELKSKIEANEGEIEDLQMKLEDFEGEIEDLQMKLNDFEGRYGYWESHNWKIDACEEPKEEETVVEANLGEIIEELTAPDPAPEPKKRQKLIFCQYLREKDPSMKFYQSFVARWKKALKKAQEIGGDYEKEINQINLQSIRDLQGMQDTLITLDLKQRTSQLGDCINYLQKIMEETQK